MQLLKSINWAEFPSELWHDWLGTTWNGIWPTETSVPTTEIPEQDDEDNWWEPHNPGSLGKQPFKQTVWWRPWRAVYCWQLSCSKSVNSVTPHLNGRSHVLDEVEHSLVVVCVVEERNETQLQCTATHYFTPGQQATSHHSNLTKRSHCHHTWTVQSYSPGGATVHPIQYMLLCTHPSPHSKRHLNRFSRFAHRSRQTVPILYNGLPLSPPLKIASFHQVIWTPI